LAWIAAETKHQSRVFGWTHVQAADRTNDDTVSAGSRFKINVRDAIAKIRYQVQSLIWNVYPHLLPKAALE
jgi:hypothetical protein